MLRFGGLGDLVVGLVVGLGGYVGYCGLGVFWILFCRFAFGLFGWCVCAVRCGW